MKKLLAIIIAAAGFAAAAPAATAGGHGHGHGHCGPRISVCFKVKLYTKEVCRHYFYKTVHNHCGQCYTVRYVSITYRDFYSNGSSRSYKRTFRA